MNTERGPADETPVDAIQKFQEPGGDLLHLDAKVVQNKLRAIEDFQRIVHSQLKKDLDYGVIPGTQKPTLLKPGAEKIAKLLNLADNYEIVEKVENWDKPFFSYTVRCTLTEIASGATVCSYVANCNSYESKYRYRWVPHWKLQKGQNLDGVYCEERQTSRGAARFYRFENEDIFSQVNTILKMAEKRALTSAVLSVGRLSLIFTVDMEDYVPKGDDENGGDGGGDGRNKVELTSGHEPAPAAANVRSEEPKAPAPADKKPEPKATGIVDGRYTDDEYPPVTEITLPDKEGTKVRCSRYKCYDLYEKMKIAIGETRYYAVLKAMGYEQKTDVPDEELHLVYAMLAGEWKKLRGGKK
jgi:hypothetical protein